jgi:formylglycine-generating enzyme required for sulfatase activity
VDVSRIGACAVKLLPIREYQCEQRSLTPAASYINRSTVFRILYSKKIRSPQKFTAMKIMFYSHKFILATASLLAAISLESLTAATIHIATTGSDYAGTGQVTAPFATIQKGISHAQEGDTVLVAAGTYTGEGNRNSDLMGKAINVKSVSGPQSTILDLEQNRSFVARFGESLKTIIDGFTILNGYASTGQDWGGIGIISISGDSSLTIKNCIFTNNKVEVSFFTARANILEDHSKSGSVIENCLFYGNICRGGYWMNTSYSNVIYGRLSKVSFVTVCDNRLESSVVVYRNYDGEYITVWVPGGLSVSLWEKNGSLTNSIIIDNGNKEISCAYSPITPTYNLTDGAISDPTSNVQVYTTGYTQLNPLFVNPQDGDFSLSLDSPAIDAGDPAVLDPDGTNSDIGFNMSRIVGWGQAISAFSPIDQKTYGDKPFAVVSPTSSSKLPVTLSVKSGPATIAGNMISMTGAGTVVVAANQAGNADYAPAAEVTTSLTVAKGSQTIGAFSPITTKTFGKTAFAVTPPTSSSKLPVTLGIKSGPATISGNTISMTGAGTVVVAANQAGNANYSPAAEVTTSFTVAKASQQVNFPPVGDLLLSRGAITLSASASSGLPVGFSVISGPATINGSSLTLTGSGSVTIRASQAGNGNYLPAYTSITFNIKPNTSAPTLVSLSKSWFYYNAQPNTVVANLSAADPDSGDRVTYRLVSGTGSNDNGKFTLLDGVLRTATNFDLNIQRSASVRIRASDSLGQYKDQIFNLILVDPNPWAAFELKAPPFTESPSYVNVVFQLRDKERRRINLPQELLDQSGDWFVVSEDGKPITPKESILQVARNEVPLKVRTVLLLDNSNSVGADLKTIKSAAKTFVDRMFQTQEIAIYSFSEGTPNLVKDFTVKNAAGQKALKFAIDGIKLGSPSTNLYGSVLAMLQLPKWKESFTLAGIETGCLVVMTDGSDTAGLATLSAAIQKRNSDKKQIFAVGLGADIDPAALNSLQNGDTSYTPVLNPTQLAAAFTKIQSIIEDGANNFYWLNYASPKRGNINRKLTIALKNNINGAANRMINTQFNSNGFSSILPGVVINRRVNVASGVTSLRLPINTKITANAFTMLGYKGVPVYTWSVGNAALASVVPIGSDGAQANILSKGLDGTTKLTLRDKVNGFSKTIDLIIGTGVAPVSKSANVVQSAQLSSPATQESVAMMDISSLSEATPSLAGSSPKVSDTLKSKESFSLIPAGSFTMGDSLDGISDAPRRTVALDAYYISKYEVTKVEWDEVRTWALSNGYTDLAAGSGKASNHPVQSISWYDMVKWCNARSQKEGLTPVYYINNAQTTVYKTGSVDVTNAQVKWSANGYRLPTEAEWEKAARGGLSGKRFPWGNTISHSRANYYATSDYKYDLTGNSYHHPSYKTGSEPYTSPVGAFAANGYGLYDMAGNVFEWCWDWHVKYSSGSQSNPRGATSGTYRVGRGGGWYIGAEECRVAYRDSGIPADWDSGVGFRVARSLPAGPPQITSDLSKVIITKGKSTAPYAVLTNFLAKNFSASNLPPGLRLQSNGVISGTPTKSGTYKVTIVAKKIQDGKVVKSAKATKIFEVK